MAKLLEHTAEILEKMASYIDAVESNRINVENTEKMKSASVILEKLQDLTGGSLEENLANKIANTDKDVIGLLDKIASTIQDADSLGGPSERASVPAGPLSTKERSKLAEHRFLSWLMS